MKENLIASVYGVLDKYVKTYSKDGVMKNLYSWKQNKRPLVDLLRKHPNWNEEALAVIFEVMHSREIDRYVVNDYKGSLFDLYRDVGLSSEDAHCLRNALDAAAGSYAKLLPDERVISHIKDYSGVSCSVGQKASRVINRICRKYGLDRHPDYNVRFARLADSLNPMQVKRTALLSVHPCDFLEMSNEDNSWNSCHCIREGEYHAGTLSYMNDPVSMIFYTVDEDVSGDYYSVPKRTRQVFCYGDGILLQSRLYPNTDDEEARNVYRDIVQRTISHCLDTPNLWKLYRDQDYVNRHCITHSDALQYADYAYGCYKSNVSLLESVYGPVGRIVIGSTAYCLDCSDTLHAHDSLYCNACNVDIDYVTCADCGERVELDSEEDFYIDGDHYCRDCVSYCEHCESYTRDDLTDATSRYGYSISICDSCRDEHYTYCEDCGRYFHNDAGEELDDGFHCQSCLDSRYFTCHRCGDYVRCEDTLEIHDKLYCTDCAGQVREEMKCKCCAAV